MSTVWLEPLAFGKAWIGMLTSPWWWAACFLSVCQTVYTRRRERKHFGSYIEKSIPLVRRTLVLGIATGIVLSFVLSSWNFPFKAEEVVLLWGITLLFTLGGIRFSCISYAVGFISLAKLILQLYPITLPGIWSELPLALGRFHATAWLWFVAGLHFVEWLLIRLDGSSGSFPVLMKNASQEVVNGFMLRKSWPVPLLLSTQAGFMPFPMLLSFSRLTLTKPLEQQKRLSSTLHLFLGMGLFLLMVGSLYSTYCLWVAAMLMLFGHEIVYQFGKWREKQNEPLFVSNERGLKVFAVLPNSPAMAMGIKTGDVIQRLNGERIYTHKDLEKAVKDAAFCKLEVLDEYLDRHMMQKVLYQDDPKHLGIVGAVPIGKRMKKEIS